MQDDMLDFQEYQDFQEDFATITKALKNINIDEIEYYDFEFDEEELQSYIKFYGENGFLLLTIPIEDEDIASEILLNYFDLEDIETYFDDTLTSDDTEVEEYHSIEAMNSPFGQGSKSNIEDLDSGDDEDYE